MTTPYPVAPKQDSSPLRDAISAYHEACDAIAAWEERREGAASVIMDLLPEGAEMEGIQVMPPRRTLSPELAQKVLDPLRFLQICEVKPVASKARKVLTEDELAQIYTTSTKPFVRRST